VVLAFVVCVAEPAHAQKFKVLHTFHGAALSVAAPGTHHRARPRLSFARPIKFGTAVQGPSWIAAGDLNHDGLPDIAVVSGEGGGMYPYLSYATGKGNGRFGRWLRGPSTYAPTFVLLADATGKGRLDALTNDSINNGDMMVAFGNGHGGFQSYQDFTDLSVNSGNTLAVADVNSDGIPDILGSGSSNQCGACVFVMLGQGNEQFGQPAFFSSGGQYPQGIAVGSLRNNGIQDIVVANYGGGNSGGNLGVLLGNGDGTFQNAVTYSVGQEPSSVVLGDFNGDGILDVALTSLYKIHVLLGNGDGSFQPAKAHETGEFPHGIAAADFNGDGKLDLATLVTPNGRESYVSILLGTGDGTFRKPRKFGVRSLAGMQFVVADFNHDGRHDIATVNGDSTVSVLLNTTKFPAYPQQH
jgi:hypothetical protein